MMQAGESQEHRMSGAMLGGIFWPVVLGCLTCGGFYAAMHAGFLRHPLMLRYFAGDPIEYVETGLGFIGLVALLLRGAGLTGQAAALRLVHWDAPPASGARAEHANELLAWLAELPGYARGSYLVRRLQAALQYVAAKGSGDGLDEELKYLSDADAAEQHDG